MDAAAIVVGEPLTVDDLTPAMAVRLVDVAEEQVRFRHPLMRSAIHQSSSIAQRHAAHAALAEVLTGDGADRRVWLCVTRQSAAERRFIDGHGDHLIEGRFSQLGQCHNHPG